MSNTKSSSWEQIGKPIVVLTVISLVTSLLLAIVNSVTSPVIAANQKATTLAAYVEVMPTVSDAASLDELTDYSTANVTGAVKAQDGSVAVKAEESGFDGGILTVIMGFDSDGNVTGMWVDASKQTSGIGSHVGEDSFLAQFDSLTASENIAIGQGYDGYTGATISSKALFAAINDCINCYNELA